MSSREQITVLVADERALIRRSIAIMLNEQGGLRVLAEAASGRDAVEFIATFRPNVAVLALSLPIMNGLQTARKIRNLYPDCRCILLTDDEALVSIGSVTDLPCLSMGCTPSDLVSLIRHVHAERTPRSSGWLAHCIERTAARAALTDLEAGALRLLVEMDSTNAQIGRVLSKDLKRVVTEASIKHALERAMTKLEVEPRSRASLVKAVLNADSHDTDVRAVVSAAEIGPAPDERPSALRMRRVPTAR